MGIVLKTNIDALVKKHGAAVVAIAAERAIAKLTYLGEYFVKEARSNGNYTDRTGNLRSSIGYVVLKNGAVVKDFFEANESKGLDGVKQAKKLASKLKASHAEGYVLICMAGMDYAVYLELHDYNVISGAEVAVKRLWKKHFSK